MSNYGSAIPKALPSAADLLRKLTGAATLAAGAMLYGVGTAQPATLSLGTPGQVLVAGASAPVWSSNVPLLNAGNTFTSLNIFTGGVRAQNFGAQGTFDATKQVIFDLQSMTTGQFLTLRFLQSTSQVLYVPDIATTDTLATRGLANTFTAAQTINVASGTVQTWQIAGATKMQLDGNGSLSVSAARSYFNSNSDAYAIGMRYNSGTGIVWIGATNSATADLQISTGGGGTIALFKNNYDLVFPMRSPLS